MTTARSQLRLRLKVPPRHGGARRGAGRKPRGARAGVTHHRREEVTRETPVHVTLRLRDHVWNLRSLRALAVFRRALAGMLAFPGFRVVHFSLQGNHLHAIVEAEDNRTLSQGVQGLSVRLAKGLNRMMGRHGAVFSDRYHAHVLRTPSEVARALAYVLQNHRGHMARLGRRASCGPVDPFSSSAAGSAEVTARPESWLLARGWQRVARPGT